MNRRVITFPYNHSFSLSKLNNVANTTEEKQEQQYTAEEQQRKDEKLRTIGITEERLLELREVMITVAERLKEKKLPLSLEHIVNESADLVKNTREALFVGYIFGQSISAMNNPLAGLLTLMRSRTNLEKEKEK